MKKKIPVLNILFTFQIKNRQPTVHRFRDINCFPIDFQKEAHFRLRELWDIDPRAPGVKPRCSKGNECENLWSCIYPKNWTEKIAHWNRQVATLFISLP